MKKTNLNFIENVSIPSLFAMWDQNSETSFFIKDLEGTLLVVNNTLVQQYHLNSKSDLLGKTDFDVLPYNLAVKYRNDDLKIQATLTPMIDIFELVFAPTGSLRWSRTCKYPILDNDGQIIAIQGTMDYINLNHLIMQKASGLYNILPYIEEHYATVTTTSLATALNTSVRSLQRYFKLHLNITPIEFITSVKLQKACEQLKEGKSLQTTAKRCGFCDQSYFTKTFQKHLGITPKEYIGNFCK